MPQRIEPLKKLKLQATPSGSQASAPIIFDHIFGLAPEGLSPFESALAGRKQGESVRLSVPGTGSREFFGTCAGYVQELLNVPVMPKTFEITVDVISVAEADHREVVKAIAAAASHGGCGGSCGCGCS